jgi:hypothetical protein
MHINANGWSLWRLELDNHGTASTDLDRWHPLYSALLLSGSPLFSVVPGFHRICERWFSAHKRPAAASQRNPPGRSIIKYGNHYTGLVKSRDRDIIGLALPVTRIPPDWSPPQGQATPSPETTPGASVPLARYKSQLVDECVQLGREISHLPTLPPRPGDLVLFDLRAAWQRSAAEGAAAPTLYLDGAMGYAHEARFSQAMVAIRGERSREISEAFFSKYPDHEPLDLSRENLASRLYGARSWQTEGGTHMRTKWVEAGRQLVSDRHIEWFRRYGYVVIEHVFGATDLESTVQFLYSILEQQLGAELAAPPLDLRTADGWRRFVYGDALDMRFWAEIDHLRCSPQMYSACARVLDATWRTGSLEGFRHPFGEQVPGALWLAPGSVRFVLGASAGSAAAADINAGEQGE